jgi:prephenate dehydrogenase
MGKAQKLGAFDRTTLSLPSAVEKADVVVLALPVDEIYDVLKIIAPELREGAVVVDTSSVKVKVSEWAKELLPENRFFVTMTPTLNPLYLQEQAAGVDLAHADLFKNSLMVITSPSGTDADALKLAADLTALLGAQPFFADAYESDGLLAGSALLPRLAAASLLHAVIGQPGWQEGRKLAGKTFAQATLPALELESAGAPGKEALLNRENALRVLDNYINELSLLRQLIEENNEEMLGKHIEHALAQRELWLKQRHAADWEQKPKAELPSARDLIGGLFMGRFRKPTEKK